MIESQTSERLDFRIPEEPEKTCPARKPRTANLTLLNNFRLEQLRNLTDNIAFILEEL